jgi:hypothetical protein
MLKTHTRILGIAPYDGMYTAMKLVAQAYPDVELDVYIGDLEEGQAIVEGMPPNTYDCIISRGGTASLIQKVTDVPVVEIHISVYDVLRTMKLAENYSNSNFAHRFCLCTLKIQYLAVIQLSKVCCYAA